MDVEKLKYWAIQTLVVWLIAYLLPGVMVENVLSALLAALVIGLVNAFLKPVLLILTLPINVISLGLFTFVINAFLIQFASAIVPGFEIKNFAWALLFSLILSCVNFFLKIQKATIIKSVSGPERIKVKVVHEEKK